MRTSLLAKGAALAAIVLGVGAAGCADLSRAIADSGPAQTNVESPVAPAIIAAQTRPMAYPSFRDLPGASANPTKRTPFEWRRTISGVAGAGREVSVWAAENPVLSGDRTDTFNAAALKELKYLPANDAPPADQVARTEAWAQSQRVEAAAPPSPR
ncbi:hypothetical protein BH09PSE2_BH09PSE2_19690 [soil metagenome]